ncbi:MAG: prepilin-type N-terminal cleavage/methylation domain-containing protein [Opitutaceae bacterium]|nr:prepilin-type N-terminal cleavage/methylation domain-containing protein [Opitutaceae bacterium]
MKINTRSTKGFTLVEIMIVVVIIGLLAAMAIPAFQKVRENSIGKAMENDARQVASAAQQYFLENAGVTTIPFTVATATGLVDTSTPLAVYVKQISKGTAVSANIVLDTDFTMTNAQYKAAAVQSFNSEGKKK